MTVTTAQLLRLDCASRATTEAGLSAVFSCTVEQLRSFVADPAREAFFEANWSKLPAFEDWLYAQACEQFGPPTLPTELCWFHGTRVPAGTTFAEGIFPLGQGIGRLREAILSTLDDEAAQAAVRVAFDRQHGKSMHFRNKVDHDIHWGPFAILVREVADHASAIGQHDYLAMPEIIDDLCEEVRISDGLDIRAAFEQRWVPAMVKFWAPCEDSSARYAVATALCYLRECALRGRSHMGAVWCFDGENVPVAPERIVGIEWVTEAHISAGRRGG